MVIMLCLPTSIRLCYQSALFSTFYPIKTFHCKNSKCHKGLGLEYQLDLGQMQWSHNSSAMEWQDANARARRYQQTHFSHSKRHNLRTQEPGIWLQLAVNLRQQIWLLWTCDSPSRKICPYWVPFISTPHHEVKKQVSFYEVWEMTEVNALLSNAMRQPGDFGKYL